MNAPASFNRFNAPGVTMPLGSGTSVPRIPSGPVRSPRQVTNRQRRVAMNGVVIMEGDLLQEVGPEPRLRRTLHVRRRRGWNWMGICGQPDPTGSVPTGDVLIIVVPSEDEGGPNALSVVVSTERATRMLLLCGLELISGADWELREPECSAMISTVNEMWSRSGTGRALDRLHLDALVHRLVALVHPGDARSVDQADPRLVRALRHVEAHLGEQLSVAGVADVAGMSEVHFARRFRAAMGEPVWSYVQRRRAEQAFDLLSRSSLGLADIAFACGYASQAHMTTSVKHCYGQTPGTIRKHRLGQPTLA